MMRHSVRQMARVVPILLSMVVLISCAERQVAPPSSNPSPAASKNSPALSYIPENLASAQKKSNPEFLSQTQLDDKSKAKVDDAFKGVILNDDKKAKTAYGRSYKLMPEFVQFAFDLRFKNFDHALELLPTLPYSEPEKVFWQEIIKKKPANFAKQICDQFKEKKFEIKTPDILPQELMWSQEYYGVMNNLLKEEQAKSKPSGVTYLNSILGKVKFKDASLAPLPLDLETQKQIFNEAFFDTLRNAQRRDTRFWMSSYKNVLKAWVYQRGYLPIYVYDLYSSMSITDNPRVPHFLKRAKGIIKDMRVESLLARNRGDTVLDDTKDMAKLRVISKFMNRYPFISVFLYFEPLLSGCDL